MTSTQSSSRRRFGVLAAITSLVLGVAGVMLGGAPAFASVWGATPAPTLFSDGAVGDEITTFVGDWNPDPDSYSYQWNSNDLPISGASGISNDPLGNDINYTPTVADEGHTISLTLVAHKAGYPDVTETSDDTAPLGEPFLTSTTPTIDGSTTLGSTLTADPNTADWGPGTVTFAYQWYLNGSELYGETNSTYVTTGRDSGQYISVKVTGSETGYRDTSATSDDFGPISGTVLTISGTVTGLPTDGGTTPGNLDGILVEAYQGNDGSYIGYDYTQDGHYSISFGAVSDTSGYTVEFNQHYYQDFSDTGAQYVYEFLGGSVDIDSATTFSLTDANPTHEADAQLALASTVSGIVKGPDGTPLSGADVSIDPVGQYNGPSTETASDGTYTLHQVGTNDTIATADAFPDYTGDDQNTQYYNNQWWDHASSAAAATPITVTPSQPTSGINFDLTSEATVTGRVVDSDGNGVPYMDYVPWHYDPIHNDYVSPRSGPFLTDGDGYFTVPSNSWGGYKLQFFDTLGTDGGDTVARTTSYNTTFYGGDGSIATATPITFSGPSDHIDIGNVVVTPHTGGPSWSGTPEIDAFEDVDSEPNWIEIDGGVPSPGTATVAYQWFRDGVAIPGATDGDYELTSDDTGHILTATLTASVPGFADATITTSPYDLRSNFTVNSESTLTGASGAKVGDTLQTVAGSYTPTPDSTGYQWYRQVGTGTPTAIPNATASSYVLTPADLGDTVSVGITSSKTGYVDHTISLSTTGTVLPGILTTATPTITNSTPAHTTPVYGDTLTAVTAGWGPGTVSFTYQWLSDGTAIPGATSNTYALQTGDVTHKISVSVIGSETGYTTSAAFTSSQTTAVAGATLTTATPTITNSTPAHTTPIYGDTLTAATAGWGPGTVSFTYQWLSDGTVIAGATSKTYAVQTGDVTHRLSVTVTGSEAGYATSPAVASAQTTAVAGAAFSETTAPSISLSPVANTYSVTNGTWAPVPTTVTYQWYANGTLITGATGSSYTPVAADANKTLTATVTVGNPGYVTANDTATASAPVIARFTSEPPPTLAVTLPAGGSVAVGSTLTATPGAWSPTPDSVEYTWVSYGSTGSCASGYAQIQGAGTGNTYVVAANLAGAHICVRQTDDLAHFRSDTVSSVATAAVGAGTLTAATPTITGTATFGSSLTAHANTWTPAVSNFTYQWYRIIGSADPQPISGATSSTYVLQTADIGNTLTVKVTGALTGYTTATSGFASATTTILSESFRMSPNPTVSPSAATAGTVLTASTGTWAPTPTSFGYQWYADGTIISGATNKTYTVTAENIGQSLTVTVTGVLTGYTSPTPESSPGIVPTASWSSIPTPTITGTAKTGATITAHAGSWLPAGIDDTTYTYTWAYSSTTVVTDPSSSLTSDFVVPAGAYGHTITVKVTVHAPGYPTATTVVSKKTATVAAGTMTPVVPTISGSLAVGEPLTAVDGTWSPASTTFKYQWYRGSSAISGATKQSYTPTGSDLAMKLKVRVTGSSTGYTSLSSTSAATTAITIGTFTHPATPIIVGAAVYGTKLTINEGTWGPVAPSYAYQWYSDGVKISKATSSTYTLGTANFGHAISVKVTASKSGFTTVALTSTATDPVVPATFATAPTPTVTGTLAVGSTLTAANATPSPSSSVTKKYQWYRQSLDGSTIDAISKATASTYKLVAADAGDALFVTVTYAHTGYTSDSKSSAPTTGIWVSATPTISGTAAVSDSLTALPGAWSPNDPSEFTYQWYSTTGSKTTAISGATDVSYAVQQADLGKKITVKVTASAEGFAPLVSASSKATSTVATPFAEAPNPTIVGSPTYGVKLSINKGTWAPVPTFAYQWYRDGSAISGATSSTYTLPSTAIGHAITVRVTGSKTGYATVSETSDPTALVDGLHFASTPAAPAITGTAKVGSTLTGKAASSSPSSSVTVTYQWYRQAPAGDPTAIASATKSTYKLVAADAGDTISVTAKYTRTGYDSVTTVQSASTGLVAS